MEKIIRNDLVCDESLLDNYVEKPSSSGTNDSCGNWNFNSADNSKDVSDISEDGEMDENEKREEYIDSDSDIPLDDIDSMLEEGLDSYKNNSSEANANVRGKKRKADTQVSPPHEERKKIVLKSRYTKLSGNVYTILCISERDQDYFEVLPEGWIEVTHFSGMPIYLHKQTRVCTVSKPYHLGPGSARVSYFILSSS